MYTRYPGKNNRKCHTGKEHREENERLRTTYLNLESTYQPRDTDTRSYSDLFRLGMGASSMIINSGMSQYDTGRMMGSNEK